MIACREQGNAPSQHSALHLPAELFGTGDVGLYLRWNRAPYFAELELYCLAAATRHRAWFYELGLASCGVKGNHGLELEGNVLGNSFTTSFESKAGEVKTVQLFESEQAMGLIEISD